MTEWGRKDQDTAILSSYPINGKYETIGVKKSNETGQYQYNYYVERYKNAILVTEWGRKEQDTAILSSYPINGIYERIGAKEKYVNQDSNNINNL